MTWTRAPIVAARGFVEHRSLLLVVTEGDPVGASLTWTGEAWGLRCYPEDRAVVTDDELAVALLARELPAVELGELRWLRGCE